MKHLGLEGSVMALPTVPHMFLRDAPLLGGEWINAYVVELTEWGTRLVRQGLVVEEPLKSTPKGYIPKRRWRGVLTSGV